MYFQFGSNFRKQPYANTPNIILNDDKTRRVTSLSPIAYVCGSQFSRKLNFLYRFLARWPWHPSPKIVTLAWSSMPRSNVG